jgi:hypothetical protein
MANTYNALDFGLDPTNTPAANQVALQSAVTAAEQDQGGRIVIPAFGAYPITGTIAISISDQSAISIVGSSGSALLQKSDSSDLFTITNNGKGDGVLFQDLHVQYTEAFSSVAAFRFSLCQNGRLVRVILNDCPLGVVLTDSEQCSVTECSSIYQIQNNATLITVNTGGSGGSQQNRIYACNFEVAAATGCTGLNVTQSADLNVSDSRFIGFANAITIAAASGQSVVRSLFTGVACETTSTAVTIKPASGGTAIQEVYFSHSQFRPTGSPAASTPGVDVDISGTSNSQVDTIIFDDCVSVGWPGSGIQVNQGQNVQVTGGRYSSNGTTDAGSAGIALTSTVTNVRIIGADCTGTLLGLTQQQNGVAVTNGATNVFVSNCDLTGNSNLPLYTSSPGNLAVINCAGYNDKANTISATPPSSGLAFNGVTFRYYGPVAFYVWGGNVTHISIDGTATTLTQGGFTLNAPALAAAGGTAPASETGAITFGIPPPTFMMVGK